MLAALREARGAWVPLPKLVRLVGGYAIHSRAANLREAGYPVECAVAGNGEKKHSRYRLVEASQSTSTGN